jgi:transposase
MEIRDTLGPIFEDKLFSEMYPKIGQPAASPTRLALVTILQFMEDLTDREAADSVRSRIDWKYLLGLELNDPGFHYSVLSEFRLRLLENKAEQMLLERILEGCQTAGLLKGKKKQRTDSTRVLANIRVLNRIELVGETMRRVLDDIAQIAPDWLKPLIQPEWGK